MEECRLSGSFVSDTVLNLSRKVLTDTEMKVLEKGLDFAPIQRIKESVPMVSLWAAQKLSSYLVRAKLYPLERSVGSFKCNGKHCQVCINVTESNTFSSSVGKKEYVINHSFNCYEKCIIYLLTYNKCKMKYVGKTFDAFRLRWNNYEVNNRKYLRKETRMQQHLFEHFSSEGHSGFLDDISIIFIDKTDPKNPEKREQ